MDSLLKEQELTIHRLSNIVSNYKKVGKANFTAATTAERLQRLREEWSNCTRLHLQLELKATAEDRKSTYFVDSFYERTERIFDEASDYLVNLLASFPKEQPAGESRDLATEKRAAPCRLESIPIPRFDGSIIDWPSFADNFEALVIKDKSLDDVQRLYYLKGALEGPAKLVVGRMSTTSANFKSAWKLLRERYENQRVIVRTLVHQFMSIQPLRTAGATELAYLCDTTNEALVQLENLGRPTRHWDDILVYSTVEKLDRRTREEWENSQGARTDPPTFAELSKFLSARIQSLTAIAQASARPTEPPARPNETRKPPPRSVRVHLSTAGSSNNCPLCGGKHLLFRCDKFRASPPSRRREIVLNLGCCYNCLRTGHAANGCKSESRCSKCNRMHHTFLHPETDSSGERAGNVNNTDAPPPMTADVNALTSVVRDCIARWTHPSKAVLLATAVVNVESRDGGSLPVRALLDQGSQATFVSESLVQALGLMRTAVSISVLGPDDTPVDRVRGLTLVTIRWGSRESERALVPALILQRLTSYSPKHSINPNNHSHLRGLRLADPDPNYSRPVEIIIGADFYGHFLRRGIKKGPLGSLTAQQTVFGWVVSGPSSTEAQSGSRPPATSLCAVVDSLQQQLRQFWEVEEPTPRTFLSPEDQWCEDHFARTVSRQEDGRYVVRLPLKPEGPLDVGLSMNRALSVLRSVERRLSRDLELESAYRAFMEEYEALGHMSEIPPLLGSGPLSRLTFLPHHPVVKRREDGTLKLRVVFNASSKDSSSSSLNDHLLTGPKLQRDIFDVILRWRTMRIGITADIEKMFRQIRVHPDDADLQCILWRRKATADPTGFRLHTVTYGMNCAPFLAQRVLLQLAEDEGATSPDAASILRENFYVDDVLFGGDSVEEAVSRRDALITLLKAGGFSLGKWAASSHQVLPPEGGATTSVGFSQGSPSIHPVLGLKWESGPDAFRFAVIPDPASLITKRTILSTIARLYDPLGWAAPVVIVAKILLQDLWLGGCDWDSVPPTPIIQQWEKFCGTLSALSRATIPRWFGVVYSEQNVRYELHGFADASSRAYGAVAYLVTRDRLNARAKPLITLAASKTKVAPVRTVSIPRLELCAAALLASLLKRIGDTMKLNGLEMFAWTDSTVVLSWLARAPSTWKVYVANRVATIHEHLPGVPWRHVRSAENPADCASRGLSADELLCFNLWWKGPAWLSGPKTAWPDVRAGSDHTAELELRAHTAVVNEPPPASPLEPLPEGVSSWRRLLRVTGIVLRFLNRLHRVGSDDRGEMDHPTAISRARVLWLRWLQVSAYKREIDSLSRTGFVGEKSPLRRLSPFVDKQRLLRVGGRLVGAYLPYNERHPVLLPKHPLVDLLVRDVHHLTLHGGPQLTLSVLRRTYWLVGARGIVRSVVWRCVACARHRGTTIQPPMAPLPEERVRPARPFSIVGVDYAGPIRTRAGKGRGRQATKSYIAVFVCFVSKAVHLELVSDCTSSAFLAALRRFIARRGRPTVVHSDNGTNFRGAARELHDLTRQAVGSPEVDNYLGDQEIRWKFSPPNAPHFGGLWEAGVKSVKHHLRRVVGVLTLTFEEMSTLLCGIEACLNSRPLSPLSPDPNELAALTPGHFLTGAPLLNLPGEESSDSTASPCSRWQLTYKATREFWKQWYREYLHTLQERSKWWRPTQSLAVGDLVVIKEANLPPASWRMGRVVVAQPGPDGQVRVVTLRTASGTLVRPVNRVVKLPVSPSDTSSRTNV